MANELQSLLIWRKKKFSYDFFPSKAEEEEVNNTPWVVTRELIETGPAMTIDLSKLRWIKKKISPEDLAQGRLGISSFDTFEYILPYWKLDMANSLVNGSVMDVCVWDITGKNDCKKYEGETVSFRKLPNDDYSLMNEELVMKLR